MYPITLRFFVSLKNVEREEAMKLLNMIRATVSYYDGTFDMFTVNVEDAIDKIEIDFSNFEDFYTFMKSDAMRLLSENDAIVLDYDDIIHHDIK
jgi:hypothetical protein